MESMAILLALSPLDRPMWRECLGQNRVFLESLHFCPLQMKEIHIELNYSDSQQLQLIVSGYFYHIHQSCLVVGIIFFLEEYCLADFRFVKFETSSYSFPNFYSDRGLVLKIQKCLPSRVRQMECQRKTQLRFVCGESRYYYKFPKESVNGCHLSVI